MVKAKEIMNTKVVTIGRGEDLCEAMRAMVLNNIAALPVVEEHGTLAGMIAEKDVLTTHNGGVLRDSILELVF